MKKIFWTGLAAGVGILVADLAVGKSFDFLIPSLKAEYMSGIFRPWEDP